MKAVEVESSRSLLGRPLWLGTLRGLPVVVAETGISIVNASLATQCVLERFEIESIVVVGVAGAIRSDLGFGNVVVPARWGQYQESHLARRTGEGWAEEWRLMSFTPFGMVYPRPVFVARSQPELAGDPLALEEMMRFWFEADARLLALAEQVASGMPHLHVGGNAVSGSPFVDNLEVRTWLGSCFEASVIDQETAAIAHVAYVSSVPFIAFRAVSDLAGGDPGANPMDDNIATAADHATVAASAFCELLASARE